MIALMMSSMGDAAPGTPTGTGSHWLAHILAGEPVATSPGYALIDSRLTPLLWLRQGGRAMVND
jgi:hypothetical protein